MATTTYILLVCLFSVDPYLFKTNNRVISVCMYSSLNYSVYNYVCAILVVFVCTMVAERGRVAEKRHIQFFLIFPQLLSYIVGYEPKYSSTDEQC